MRQEEEEKYHGGSRMSISSRRSSVSSVGSRLLAGGRMGRAKDQTKETASQQHAAKLVANTISYLILSDDFGWQKLGFRVRFGSSLGRVWVKIGSGLGRAKDQTASQQHVAKLVANTSYLCSSSTYIHILIGGSKNSKGATFLFHLAIFLNFLV